MCASFWGDYCQLHDRLLALMHCQTRSIETGLQRSQFSTKARPVYPSIVDVCDVCNVGDGTSALQNQGKADLRVKYQDLMTATVHASVYRTQQCALASTNVSVLFVVSLGQAVTGSPLAEDHDR
jgi:hypothetical protein